MSFPPVVIRPCHEPDLPSLEAAIPSPGRSRFHEQRFIEQRTGRSTYLVAWWDGRPVGHLNLRWVGSRAAPVREALGTLPEVNALGVWPPELRSRRVGRLLLSDAERLAQGRGHATIGLGVEVGNTGARRLYERMGYVDWGRGTFSDPWTSIEVDGTEVVHEEIVTYMLKSLRSRYPTPSHGAAVDAATAFLTDRPEVAAVFLAGSCARDRGFDDIDLAAYVPVRANGDRGTGLWPAWEAFVATDASVADLAALGPFFHVDLSLFDGRFEPGSRGWTSWPDPFELEVGNYVAYSRVLWQRHREADELRARWLPFYGDSLAAERLAEVRRFGINNIDHVAPAARRGLSFHAFDRLYHALQEFLQALFIARRTYPIAYDKWIREQVDEMLGLPDVYGKLLSLLQVADLEGDELSEKAEDLRGLFNELAV